MTLGALTLQDIARTPSVLRALAARAGELEDFTRRHLAPNPGGQLYVYGCGDGLVAAECVAGRVIVARTALDMLAFEAEGLSPADRVLAVSMSGNVDRGVEAAHAVLASGAKLAVLTNGSGGRLGKTGMPRYSLEIPAIKPFLAGTATYTGTLFALLQVAGLLSGRAAPEPPAIEGLAERIRAALATVPTAVTGVRWLSAGPNRATAAHGAEKLVELTRLPSWSADIEEFAHSQFWSADPGELIVFVATDPAVAALASHSAAALRDMGFVTLAFDTMESPVEGAEHRLQLPPAASVRSPLSAATAAQVLAWHLACGAGLDPDTRAHLKNDEMRFTTSRRLTRSTLVGTGR